MESSNPRRHGHSYQVLRGGDRERPSIGSNGPTTRCVRIHGRDLPMAPAGEPRMLTPSSPPSVSSPGRSTSHRRRSRPSTWVLATATKCSDGSNGPTNSGPSSCGPSRRVSSSSRARIRDFRICCAGWGSRGSRNSGFQPGADRGARTGDGYVDGAVDSSSLHPGARDVTNPRTSCISCQGAASTNQSAAALGDGER